MKQFNRFIFILIFSSLAFLFNGYAQHAAGTLPASYQSALMFSPIEETMVAPADAEFVSQALNNPDKSGMYVIAQLKDVDVDPLNSGTWDELEDGTIVWRIRISSPGAKASKQYRRNPIFQIEIKQYD